MMLLEPRALLLSLRMNLLLKINQLLMTILLGKGSPNPTTKPKLTDAAP